ncbi:hypothetical protein SAMN02910369_00955 [Lachnospiraceae bacterium NE2001]|nr:hypothetical protein SAMN02910369_00955 [Lachnospiraceae bacterium NE2001]
MPNFTYEDSINLEEYFDLKDPAFIELFSKFHAHTPKQMKEVVVNFVLKDYIDKYQDYQDIAMKRATTQLDYDLLLDKYSNKPELTDEQKAKIANTKMTLDSRKLLEDAKYNIIKDSLDNKKELDVVRLFKKLGPKTPEEKKEIGKQVIHELVAGIDDTELYKKIKKRLKFSPNYAPSVEEKIDDDFVIDMPMSASEKYAEEMVGSIAEEQELIDDDKVKQTFEKQASVSDKMWLAMLHNVMYKSLRQINQYVVQDPEKKGIPEDCDLSDELQNLADDEYREFGVDFEINDLESAKKVIKDLVSIKTKLYIELGKEFKKNQDILANEPFSYDKARYLTQYGNSTARLLLKEFDELEDRFKYILRDKMEKLVKITGKTSMEEIISMSGKNVYDSTVLFTQNRFNPKTNVNNYYGFTGDLEGAYAEYSKTIFDYVYEEEQKAYEKNLSPEEKALLETGNRVDDAIDYEDEGIVHDDDWNQAEGDDIKDIYNSRQCISTFQKLSRILNSGEELGTHKGNDIFVKIRENDKPIDISIKEEPKRESYIDQVIKEHEEYLRQKKIDDENREIENIINTRKDELIQQGKSEDEAFTIITDELAARSREKYKKYKSDEQERQEEEKRNEQKKQEEQRKRSDVIYWADKFINGLNKTTVPDSEKLEDLKNKLKIYNLSAEKQSSAFLAATIIPSEDQLDGYKSLGINEAANAVRLTHYYLWTLGVHDNANIGNLHELCSNPENKRAYLEYCRTNALNNQNTPLWGDIYINATKKVMDYKLPDIDYSDPDKVKSKGTELTTFRTIVENADKVADCMFNNEKMNILDNHNKSLDVEKSFYNFAEASTRIINDAYINIPYPKAEKDIKPLLHKTALWRHLAGKKMDSLKNQRLFNLYIDNKNKDYAYENLKEMNYIEEKAMTALTSRQVLDYLGGRKNDNITTSLDKAYTKNVIEKKTYNFEKLQYDNALRFRDTFNDSSKNNYFVKSLLNADNEAKKMQQKYNKDNNLAPDDQTVEAEAMINFLYKTNRRLSDDTISFIQSKFDALIPKEVKDIYAYNSIKETDVILIDGKSAQQLWGEKYSKVDDPALKENLYKLEILKEYFKGEKKIDVKNYKINEKGTLSECGEINLHLDKKSAFKMIENSALMYSSINVFQEKLQPLKQLLMDALDPIKGESSYNKEKRVYTDGSDLYKGMAEALKTAIETVNKGDTSPERLREVLVDLQKKSDAYYEKRKGVFFGPREGKGQNRLKASDIIRTQTNEMLMTFDNIYKNLDMGFSVDGYKDITKASIKDIGKISANYLHHTDYFYNIEKSIFNEHFTGGPNDKRYVLDLSDKAIKDVDRKSAKQSNLIDELKKNIYSDITVDYQTKTLESMVPDKRGMSSLDFAKCFISKLYIKEMMENYTSADDVSFMVEQIKSGKVRDEVFELTRNEKFNSIIKSHPDDYFDALLNAGIKIPSIEEMNKNRQIEFDRNEISSAEKKNDLSVFYERNKLLQKYNNFTLNNVNQFRANYKKEEFANISNKIAGSSKYTVFRTAGESLTILALSLEKNENGNYKYSLEDLMDPDKYMVQKQKKYGEIINTLLKTADKKEVADEGQKKIAEILFNGQKRMTDLIDEKMKDMDFSSDNLELTKDYALVINASDVLYDAWQEIPRSKDFILDLAKAEDPNIKKMTDYTKKISSINNPLSSLKKPYKNLSDYINELDNPKMKKMTDDSFVMGSMMAITATKNILKDWSDFRKKHPNDTKTFSKWCVENDIQEKIKGCSQHCTAYAVENYGKLVGDELKAQRNNIINGTLFNNITYNKDMSLLPGFGIKGAPSLDDLTADKNYKNRGDDYRAVEANKLKELDAGKKDASPERIKYINASKTAVKRLGEYLNHDYLLRRSRVDVVKNCFKTILAEKLSKKYEEKGYTGKDLKTAVENASEFLIKHEPKLNVINKPLIDKMAYTGIADEIVNASDDALFMGEAAVAINKMAKKDYTGKTKDLIKDSAYAKTAQILRINGHIPNDVDLDTKISARQCFNTFTKSNLFKDTLKVSTSPVRYKTPKTILQEAFDDKVQTPIIVKQEYDVIDSREKRAKLQRRQLKEERRAELQRQQARQGQQQARQGQQQAGQGQQPQAGQGQQPQAGQGQQPQAGQGQQSNLQGQANPQGKKNTEVKPKVLGS